MQTRKRVGICGYSSQGRETRGMAKRQQMAHLTEAVGNTTDHQEALPITAQQALKKLYTRHPTKDNKNKKRKRNRGFKTPRFSKTNWAYIPINTQLGRAT